MQTPPNALAAYFVLQARAVGFWHSRNGLSAAIRCSRPQCLLCGQTSLMHLQRVLTQKMFACAARLLP